MKKIKTRYFVLMACLAVVVLASGCIDTDPRTKPGAPTNLVGKAVSHREIQLTWQDNSDNEDGFRVACNIYGGSNYYEIGDLPANTTNTVSSGFDPLDTHKFYIQAYNEIGEANSNIVEVTTLSGVTILDHTLGERWDGDATITGHGRNDTDEMIDSIYITVWWYDASDTLLDTDDDLITDVPAGVTFEFEVWSSVPLVQVARYEIEVTDVNIYSSSTKEGKKEMRPESEWGLSGK